MKVYIPVLSLLFTVSSCLLPDSPQNLKKEMAGPAKIVFKSADGGQTWQDISKGLPETLRVDSIRGNSFFTNDKGLYLRVVNGLYHNTPNAAASSWTREIIPGEDSSIVPGTPRMPFWGVNLKTKNGTDIWSPIFDSLSETRIRSVFETAGGAIFIGTDRGFFKTDNSGKTWKHVYAGGWAGNMAESEGILIATSKRKIIRSADNGETWMPAMSEEDVTWDVKPIKGGFVAITSDSASDTRSLSTSYDGGKTWQSIYSGLQDKAVIDSIKQTWNNRPRVKAYQTSIIQVGETFFCTHPDGIFRSSDKGKTWKLLLPSVDTKSFNLFVSGNVIYAIRSKGGC